MERAVTSNFKLGIIAGGQLGKMLIQEASKWDLTTYVLDEDDSCPAATIASVFVEGNRLDFDSVYRFGKQVDALTFEIEYVNIEALFRLESEGLKISPAPAVLELIQDKGLQKVFYQKNDIPTSPFRLYGTQEEVMDALSAHDVEYPFVQKLRKGGYDGRGVAIIHGEADLKKLLEGASVIEDKVEISKEIAVIAARNERGEIRCFPIVEMAFDPQAHLVEKLFCPSRISQEQAARTVDIATRLIERMGVTGLLAVELFVDDKGGIFVNEVAPRPHNSGHHTIESVITSQFEQHLRAILNLPLGSTHLKMPAVMLNLLGEKGYDGPVRYEGLTESLAIEGVKIHLYGKKRTRPFRKMGHVTVLSTSLDDAIGKAESVKKLIKVKSKG